MRAGLNIIEQFKRRTVPAVIVELPFPPSVNSLYRRTASGVYRSPRYQTWFRAAGNEINRQKPGRVEGPFNIAVELGRPDRKHRDLDNTLKSILDLLQEHGVIDNDALQQRTTVEWRDDIAGARVYVTSAQPVMARRAA